MKVVQIKIECDCGEEVTFNRRLPHSEVRKKWRCYTCGKEWKIVIMPGIVETMRSWAEQRAKVYGLQRAKDKINKLQNVKNKIVEVLRNEGWDDEKIENFLIVGEELIKEVVKYILWEKSVEYKREGRRTE